MRKLLATLLMVTAGLLRQESAMADNGKLLATGGISQIEGAAGGGIVPWALIAGYETRDGVGLTLHDTYVPTSDFALHAPGVAVGLFDRVELSYADNSFDTQAAGGKLGIGKGFVFRQDVFGAKVRLLGDAVYDQDSLLPQLAVGVLYKRNEDKAILHAIGAKDATGLDFYLTGTKLILADSVLLDATVRFTKANQFGILGFGGPKNDSYQPEFEGSAAYFFSKRLAVGADFRMKPNNLAFAREDDAYDLFAAYFLNKYISATVAYADLGAIATFKDQRGAFLSVQFSY